MCKANEYINKVKSVIDDNTSEKEVLTRELSRLDLLQNDILHKIELTNFNAAEGYAFAQALKLTREKRRRVKNELEILTAVSNSVKSLYGNIVKKEADRIEKFQKEQGERYYSPRVLSM